MPVLTLEIEKAAAGGRMLARDQGRVVLVSGAIPGERVSARLERTERGVAFADVLEVLTPSPDRRAVAGDARCGGNVFAHIDYARQLRIKGEIIQDGFGRIGRLPLPEPPAVTGSPEHGYRMRARLHVADGRIGFYVEGTHRLCDVGATGQLAADTVGWVVRAQDALGHAGARGVTAIDISENIPGNQRACHLELRADADPEAYSALSEGLVGLSVERADRPGITRLVGTPVVTDEVRLKPDTTVPLSRNVRAFFQGNRFLIGDLVQRIVDLIPAGPVVDLYAGVGLFGLSLAAAGREPVVAVEGDPVAGSDLVHNAAPFGGRVTAIRQSVETYLARADARDFARATVIVDPPRTGLSKETTGHITRVQPPRVVYISCDVATLARDVRALRDAGYGLTHLSGIDLFPNTAHVETIAVLTR